MRLYLSSFKIGNQPQKLAELVGENKHALVIMNAMDNWPDKRKVYLQSESEVLERLGFTTSELDLRDYFDKEDAQDPIEQQLTKASLVWVNGGNTFVLRRAMKQSGFDNLIIKFLKADRLVYGGFSAGVVLLSPSLRGLELIDDPKQVPEGYDQEVVWDGLGLINYSVAVHYKSDHPESALMDQEIEYYKKNHIPYKPLSDGQVIIINGEKTEVLD